MRSAASSHRASTSSGVRPSPVVMSTAAGCARSITCTTSLAPRSVALCSGVNHCSRQVVRRKGAGAYYSPLGRTAHLVEPVVAAQVRPVLEEQRRLAPGEVCGKG
jgi:hypothetical protein